MLFCDMDGVLADFDRGYHDVFGIVANKTIDNVDWKKVRNHKDFFKNLPPMPDFDELWGFISQFNPVILTGVPSSVKEAPDEKKAWIIKNIGEHVEVRCCKSAEKYLHAQPGDILIDDWTKYQHKWLSVDGIWVTHTAAATTIEELKRIL